MAVSSFDVDLGRVLANAIERYSELSEEWRLICDSLPRLTISIPERLESNRDQEAGEFLAGALHIRGANLRELEVCRTNFDKDAFRDFGCCVFKEEEAFFNALLQQLVWPSMQKLTVRDDSMFPKLTAIGWSRIHVGLPNLLHLSICAKRIQGPGGLIFRNLKTLRVCALKMSAGGIQEMFRACPSLETCTAVCYMSDLNPTVPVHISSSSLINLKMHMMGNRSDRAKVHVEASKLRSLKFKELNLSVIGGLPNLRFLQLKKSDPGLTPRLPKLESLQLSPITDLSHLSAGRRVKKLTITLPESLAPVTLHQLVRPRLEELSVKYRTDESIIADEMFQSKSETELMEMLQGPAAAAAGADKEISRFRGRFRCLKVVSLVNTSRDWSTRLIRSESVVPPAVQLLICSPQLTCLNINYRSDELENLGKLDARVKLPKYIEDLSSSEDE